MQLQCHPIDTPLLAVARLGLYYPLQDWWGDEGFDLLLKSNNGETLVALSVDARCTPWCKSLVYRLPKDQRTRGCGYALILVSGQGNEDLVRLLVQDGYANVNLVRNDRRTAVSAACSRGRLDIIKYLVEEAQATVDVRTECDSYISTLASACGAFCSMYTGGSMSLFDVIRYLVEEASDVVNTPIVSGFRDSPLKTATRARSLDLVKYLKLKSLFFSSCSALVQAIEERNLGIIKYLVVESHCDINHQLQWGCNSTALAAAIVNIKHL
ncbi:ankyrin repeat-containing domain protein [Aspergillus bertholletiae]|uniref:Ankyrin repeat-containing domain protein n=1 Tax=Aspergillus bertholletiae TaxID=1226010 RepID=A0A5N7B1C1_9EURO|nr:ankyrin repeat-containing domain protein [Aspergillus bertholletiae]